MTNPYGMQYGQSGNYPPPNNELLPSFKRTPPPEELRTQALQNFNEYSFPALKFFGQNAATNATLLGLTGKSLGNWIMHGGNRALMSDPVQRGIATLTATRLGAPIVSQVRSFASSPTGQKTKQITEKILDWIL